MHRVDVKRACASAALDGIELIRRQNDVRASFARHESELSNPKGRRVFEAHPPTLDGAQQAILASLEAEGIAVFPFATLFGADGWSELASSAAGFVEKNDAWLAGPATGRKRQARLHAMARSTADVRPSKKTFLRRAFPYGTSVTLETPLLKFGASLRLLDIVNSYRGLCTKVSVFDVIYTLPVGSIVGRMKAQQWHRDDNDRAVVKAFVYLTDVDAAAGPFEYIVGSARTGAFARLWPWDPVTKMYPDPAEVERRVPASARRVVTAPAGTMILCDTTGLHRGGFAVDRRRVAGVLHYVSPAALASLVERTYRLDSSTLPPDVPEPVRFAVT